MQNSDLPRRRFIKQAAGTGLVSAAVAPTEPLPATTLGKRRVSRLIAGNNPIAGHSYGIAKVTQHMLSYFGVERTSEFLLHLGYLEEHSDRTRTATEPSVVLSCPLRLSGEAADGSTGRARRRQDIIGE